MWYNRIVQDLGNIPDFIEYYENELAEAKMDCGIRGHLEKNIAALPGITEHRFNQLQEIEAKLAEWTIIKEKWDAENLN